MLKKYQIFESENKSLKSGEEVIVTYKDSKYYRQVGRVLVAKKIGGKYCGDYEILFDYGGMATFHETNLKKVIQLIEIPSGEIINISREDCFYLVAIGKIDYDCMKGSYTFKSDNRWEINDFAI
jgi:hypothetical protein